MTARFLDSFDHYTTLTKKWTATANSPSISAGNGRRGTDALKLIYATLTPSASKTIDSQSTWTVGFGLNITAIPAQSSIVCQLMTGGTSQIQLRVETSGAIRIFAGTSTLATSANTLNANTYQYIEWQTFIDNTTGYTFVHVDGVEWINVPVDDTQGAFGINTANIIRFQWGGATFSSIAYVDDVYILDGNGADNTFWGDTAITAVVPTNDGSSLQWTPSVAGTHYTLLDEIPPNTADYVDSSTPGNLDTYKFVSPVNITVKAIQENIWAATTSGTSNINGAITSGSTYFSSALGLTTTDIDKTAVWSTNPATSLAWTPATINSAEFGVSLTT